MVYYRKPGISSQYYAVLEWEDVRVWAHRDHSVERHHSFLGPVSCFSPS